MFYSHKFTNKTATRQAYQPLIHYNSHVIVRAQDSQKKTLSNCPNLSELRTGFLLITHKVQNPIKGDSKYKPTLKYQPTITSSRAMFTPQSEPFNMYTFYSSDSRFSKHKFSQCWLHNSPHLHKRPSSLAKLLCNSNFENGNFNML